MEKVGSKSSSSLKPTSSSSLKPTSSSSSSSSLKPKSSSSSSLKPARKRRPSQPSRWAELPLDMLMLIAEKLSPTADYLMFSSVCRSWRSAAGKINYPPSRQMPWLMLAEHNPKSAVRRFYNPAEDSIYKLKLPEACRSRSVGSTDGWLVVITEKMEVRMLNPMSRHHVSLPPLTGLRIFHGYEGRYNWPSTQQKFDMLMRKVCLSPGAPRTCVAMAIYGHGKLAIARPGNEVWTDINSEFWPFADVIYFDGAFHAVNYGGVVVSCNVNRRSPRVVRVANPVSKRFGTWNKYLVESSGDFLQVMRLIKYDMLGYKTIRFEVFRWKPDRQEWEEVRNLADRAIFLGHNSSFSISAMSAAAGCRPNCIYFTDTYNEGADFFDGVGRDMGVYNLEEESIVPHYTGCSVSMNSPPIWIQPNLWPAIAQGATTEKKY